MPQDLWFPVIVRGGYVLQECLKNPPWDYSYMPILTETNSRSQQTFECLLYASHSTKRRRKCKRRLVLYLSPILELVLSEKDGQ